ncbi:hypothetical protein INQ51_15910 [Maribellus sp. CM-23]|uniref:hypothetical protein n=1 Tax=Maribellus sp. CM-23 TaxID=2781026 RepID=UPI001F405494|nr:hypothetical protein [Maribellus sp. CM-23]MCE4565806.1 hypothetical protein [Maribellus sp. CM-23]
MNLSFIVIYFFVLAFYTGDGSFHSTTFGRFGLSSFIDDGNKVAAKKRDFYYRGQDFCHPINKA